MRNLADACVQGFCHHFTGKQGEVIIVILAIILIPVAIHWFKKM